MADRNNMQLDMELVKIAQKKYNDLQDTKRYGTGVNFVSLDTNIEPINEEVMRNVKVNPKISFSDRLFLLMKGKINGRIKKGTKYDLMITALVAALSISGPVIKEGFEFVQDKIDNWETMQEDARERKELDEAAQRNYRINSQQIDYRIQRQFLAEVLEKLESSPNIQNLALMNKYQVFYSMVTDIDKFEWEYQEAINNGNVDESMEILTSIKHLTSETTIYAAEEFFEYIGSSEYSKYMDAIVEDGVIYYRYEDVEQDGVYYSGIINRGGKVYVDISSKMEVIKGY